jgi:uncharacterized membrane protein
MNVYTGIKYASMFFLFLFGLLLILQGVKYIQTANNNDDLPRKVYAVGVLFIIVGAADIIIGLFHLKLVSK